MADEPLVLGIETSCDETGVGIVRGHTLLADAIASSVDEHARFGGVVPEVASRAHLEAMVPTIDRALPRGRGLRPRPGRRRGHRRPRARRCPAGGRERREGLCVRARQAPLRRQPPRVPHLRRPVGARRAAGADDGAARLRRPLLAAARAGHHRGRASPRLDHRRRRGRGLRQGGPRAEPRLPRRPGHRQVRTRGRPRGHRLPTRADGPARRPVRLLLLRSQDGRRPLDRGQAQRGRGGARRGRVRVLPGGGHGRADAQGDPGLQGRGRGPPDDRRRCGRQLPAARHGGGALRGRGDHPAGAAAQAVHGQRRDGRRAGRRDGRPRPRRVRLGPARGLLAAGHGPARAWQRRTRARALTTTTCTNSARKNLYS